MNLVTRTMVTAGLALTAGAAFGASPAMAAPAASAGTAASAQTTVTQAQAPRRDRIVGYYRSLRACEFVGRVGERRDRWDDYDCFRVRNGGFRSVWALRVEWDRDGHGNGHGHGHGHGNGDGHGHGHGGHGDGHGHGGHGPRR